MYLYECKKGKYQQVYHHYHSFIRDISIRNNKNIKQKGNANKKHIVHGHLTCTDIHILPIHLGIQEGIY